MQLLPAALWLVTAATIAAAAPQLSVRFEAGQLEARVAGLPAGARVEFVLHSDRNTAVSHSAEVSPHDPRGLVAKERATYWYPVVDVALEPDHAALARFDTDATGRATINGMFRPQLRPLAAELRLAAADLRQWENTIAVEPEAALRGFALLASAPVHDGVATRGFRPLTPHWRGEIEARITLAPDLVPLVLRAPTVAAAQPAATDDPLIALRARGLDRARLLASLQASIAFLLRMQDRTPGSPTHGGLNLFYDHAARTFRRPHWIWANGPAVKLLLDAAAGPVLPGDFDSARLRRVAVEIGEATRRFQLNIPGNPADGVVVSRWREAEGRLAQNSGFDQFYSVADALFLVGWAWVPLGRETGDRGWIEAGERVVAATERLMREFDLIPMDYLFPPGEWKNWTIDEAGFAPEGLAALHAATSRDQLRGIGQTYMERLTARFEQPDGRWARRIDFKPERVLLTPRVTRGVGWAMEGLVANYELTSDRRWLEKAIRLAAHLQTAQQPDGAWAFEYDQPVAKVGVGEKATALWSLLFYRLHRHTADPAHLAAARRALGWCLDNQYAGPDRDGHGGIVGLNVQSGVTYRPWFPLACAYTSAFFGLAVREELALSALAHRHRDTLKP